MDIFLSSHGKTYSYQFLIDEINKKNEYFPLYKTNDLFLFFVNFVKAIANNQKITLIDSDVNISEISNFNASLINKAVKIDSFHFDDYNSIISSIHNSTSDITIFTSGTTGQPKKVIHSIKTLTRAVRKGEKYKNQVWAYAYNPTHMAGLQVFFQAFENKNTLINVFNLQRQEILKNIEKYRITHISATPTFYRLLLPFERKYHSVIRATLGGEKSNNTLYDNIKKIFPNAQINNVYASTEAGSLFASRGDCFQIPSAIRSRFIVKDDELLIHHSLLGKSESFTYDGEYYHSGDLIEWVNEAEGIFKFKSRKNELINVGGYKVNPQEVEDILNTIDDVEQSLVYGKQNSVLGNVLLAEIKLKKDSNITEIDIRKKLKTLLQDFKIPRKIIFVESFSLTRTGKIKRV